MFANATSENGAEAEARLAAATSESDGHADEDEEGSSLGAASEDGGLVEEAKDDTEGALFCDLEFEAKRCLCLTAGDGAIATIRFNAPKIQRKTTRATKLSR